MVNGYHLEMTCLLHGPIFLFQNFKGHNLELHKWESMIKSDQIFKFIDYHIFVLVINDYHMEFTCTNFFIYKILLTITTDFLNAGTTTRALDGPILIFIVFCIPYHWFG